ncbi:MAG: nucleotidyltransferase [Parcubacteria group bacterium Athens1014_10]|nr:MAG: nucleotidyltransferase [Parcubacteria group bacterium Athens1014_10]TSD05474.1 MAG: nucleotidyltransferase [Parcubacteria group bacterium Athens0714_12]
MKDLSIKEISQILSPVFRSLKKVGLVYLFGSTAENKKGPMSDYDFAVYFAEKNKKKIFDLRCELMDKISRTLKTDKVDLVVLNVAEGPELKYNIIKEGKLIFEREPYKVLIEPKILNEYFDFHSLLLRHNLTKA